MTVVLKLRQQPPAPSCHDIIIPAMPCTAHDHALDTLSYQAAANGMRNSELSCSASTMVEAERRWRTVSSRSPMLSKFLLEAKHSQERPRELSYSDKDKNRSTIIEGG